LHRSENLPGRPPREKEEEGGGKRRKEGDEMGEERER
jgi:hypothetical protein